MEFKELKTTRLVCKSWYDCISRELALRSKFTLHSNDDKRNKLPELTSLLKNSNIFFITSLTLYLDDINDQAQQLLNVCYGKITELQVFERYEEMHLTFTQFCNILQNSEKLSVLRICLPDDDKVHTTSIFDGKHINLSKLRKLQFIGYASRNNCLLSLPYSTQYPIFKEIFDAACSLEELAIDVGYRCDALPALTALKNANKFQNIQSLEIYGSFTPECCSEILQLRERGFCLKSLKLDVRELGLDTQEHKNSLEKLLLKQVGNLANLHLICVIDYGENSALDAVLQMPVVVGLPKLTLVLMSQVATCRFVGGIHPIRYSKGCSGWRVERNDEGETTITSPNFQTAGRVLLKMKNAYPNTICLKICCYEDCLPIICGWNRLRHLRINYNGKGLTLGLLGLTTETLNKIVKNKLYKNPKQFTKIVRLGPTITDLTGNSLTSRFKAIR